MRFEDFDSYFYTHDYMEFYQMPFYFYEPHMPFVKMKGTSKELYMLLYARNGLSVKSFEQKGDDRFIDDEGRIFCIFQQKELMERLNVTKPTLIKSMKELEDRGLVVKKKMGRTIPNRYYLQKLNPLTRKRSYDYNLDKKL